MDEPYDRKVNHEIEEEKGLTGCIWLLIITINNKRNEL